MLTRWLARVPATPSLEVCGFCHGEPRRKARKKVDSAPRSREEWVAVPVTDSGIPRETVEAARHIVSNNKPCSSNGDRLWELSGGILRVASCAARIADGG